MMLDSDPQEWRNKQTDPHAGFPNRDNFQTVAQSGESRKGSVIPMGWGGKNWYSGMPR